MYEFSGELLQTPRESSQINEVAKQKLNTLPGDEIVAPSVLDISPERAENIYQQFEKRIRAETDIEKVVDGIIPSEALFSPDMALQSIDTKAGPVEIKKIGKVRQAMINSLLRLMKVNAAQAWLNPRSRRITIVPELDTFSTLVAVAKGNFQSVVGPILAHEATHAHQTNKLKPLDYVQTGEILHDAWHLQEVDPELKFSESVQLVGRSRDLAIIQESQAYILQYMLTGGDGYIDPKAISGVRSFLTETLEKNSDPKLMQLLEKLGVNSNTLSRYSERYSENGFPSILDLVAGKVRYYLPKKDQNNKDYLNRISSATLKILRLLDKGVSHLQVADLLRDNLNSIHAGTEWDESSQKYKFLQQAIEQHPNQEQIDDKSLLDRFNRQMENRVMKIRAIATEELMR